MWKRVGDLQEGNIYDDIARRYGYKPYRDTGKHPVYRDAQGNQVTVATSGQSRGSGPKNFEAQLRRLQKPQSTSTQSTTKPSTTTTTAVKPQSLSPAQRRLQPVVKVPPAQSKLSFSDFAQKAYASKDKVMKAVQPTLSTAQRMANAWKQNVLQRLDPKELVRLGNKALSDVTGATAKKTQYVSGVDRPIPRPVTFSGRSFSGGPGGGGGGGAVFNRLGR